MIIPFVLYSFAVFYCFTKILKILNKCNGIKVQHFPLKYSEGEIWSNTKWKYSSRVVVEINKIVLTYMT